MLKVLFDWPDASGGSAGGGTEVWAYVPVWRPDDRAMICSCRAADGERSKWEATDKGLGVGNALCWD